MGRILCERHGKSGIALVCRHLAAEVRARRRLSKHATYPLELDGVRTVAHDFCAACVEELGLPVPAGPLDAEEWEGLPTSPVCARCYAEAAGL